MKKIFNILFVALSVILVSCAVDEPSMKVSNVIDNGVFETVGPKKVNVNSDKIICKVNGKIVNTIDVTNNVVYFSSDAYNIVSIYDAETGEFIANETVGGTSTKSPRRSAPGYSLIDVQASSVPLNVEGMTDEFISRYPENADNWLTGDLYDFLYVSDGEPFTIYPIYSNTSNKLVLGIFYFDTELVKHNVDIYEMDAEWYSTDATPGNTYPGKPYHFLVNKTNPMGIQLTIPAGMSYGLYVYTTNTSDHVVKYSMQEFNTCISSHKTHKSEGPAHAVTYALNGYSFVGFDDGHSNVADFNDWIIVMNPEQEVMLEPTSVKVQEKIDSVNAAFVSVTDSLILVARDSIDVECRLKDPYPYLRICVPCNPLDTFTVDFSIFSDYVSVTDDFRIVTGGDIQVDTVITVTKINNKIIVKCPDGFLPGQYQLKLELRPNSGTFGTLVGLIKDMIRDDYDWTTILKRMEE